MEDLSRIYQGRVVGLELETGDKANPWRPLAIAKIEAQDQDAPLWCHHDTFQAATNYYLLALAAMVDPKGDGSLVPLRQQIERCWDDVPHRQGEKFQSLKNSVSRYLGLDQNATIEDAFATILEGNVTPKPVLDAAVSNLADQLAAGKGGGNVQQIGRAELPKFCTPDCTANFAGDPLLLKRAYHQKLLPWVLYFQEGLSPESPELAPFDVYSIATPNKKSPEKLGKEAKSLLESTVEDLRKAFPDKADEFGRISKKIEAIEEKPFRIQNYVGSSAKGAVKLRLFALLLFRHVEKSEFTLSLLRETHKKPPEKKPEPVEIDESAVDPLELSRGERGYVFPAFTALPVWSPERKGEPRWTELDVSAFKEALKTLNQFRQKTEERRTWRTRLENLEQWILEADEKALKHSVDTSKGKEAAESEEDGERHFTFKGDKRIKLIGELIAELRDRKEEALQPLGGDDADNADASKTQGYRIHFGTLRGFFDLRDDWNQIHKKAEGEPADDDLTEAVRELQRRDRYGIGSAPLFFRLCEKKYWNLWLERTDAQEADRAKNFWAKSPLHAWAEYGNLREEIERLRDPIRFTPADPRRSRRLSMLSDFSGKSKTKFGTDPEKGLFVECSLAVQKDGILSERRARLFYAARRMRRDGIPMDDADRRWIQPMVDAFGFPPPEKPMLQKDPAVALMPQFGRLKDTETVRMLLNFPIQIDPGWLVERIARTRWPDTEKEGRALEIAAQWLGWTNYANHIHWGEQNQKTGTFKPANAKGFPKAPFHEDPDIQKHGFSVLAFDLGQRDAGGYALLETRCDGGPFFRNRKPIQTLGIDEAGREWQTAAVDFGLVRLPGEDATVFRPKAPADSDTDPGKAFRTELYGEAGRNATPEEWKEARDIATRLGISTGDQLNDWLGETATEFSFPEQNDKLILISRRAQSRLASWQRWSWKLKDKDFRNSGLEEIENTFAKTEDAALDSAEVGWAKLAKEKQADELRKLICDAIVRLKESLRVEIVNIANRVLPLRDRSWTLRNREDGIHIELTQDGAAPKEARKIKGQRGLSLKRIAQLEDFRRRVLSLNRSNGHKPGERPDFGKRGLAPEPCRDILDRIDRLKEQRINQTAHLILAKALGVRLKAPSLGKDQRRKRDIHGEYERIPGRKPADLIVIEDLNRYTSSQGRSRRENSTLMKWCHRAVRDKLVELCEPFGISVLEVQPAYSSRFHAKTGHAGFRAVEIPPLTEDHFLRRRLEEKISKATDKGLKPSDDDRNLDLALRLLDELQKKLEASGRTEPKHRRTLLIPRDGGPIFLSAKDGGGFQADINAAVNLGLLGIAKHDNFEILRKIRAEKKKDKFQARLDNQREKATFDKKTEIKPTGAKGFGETFLKQQRANFFADLARLAPPYDRAQIDRIDLPITSARALLGRVKEKRWERCWEVNFSRIRKNTWLSDGEILKWEEKAGVPANDRVPDTN